MIDVGAWIMKARMIITALITGVIAVSGSSGSNCPDGC